MSVANHKDPGNPCIRPFGVAERAGKMGEPCGTMVSGGATSTPLLDGRKPNKSSRAYAELLDRELPRDAPPSNGMRLASFFCCGGGFDLGFRSAGFELAFANDYFAPAVETFARNLGHRPVLRDIREVGVSDYGHAEGCDVLTGGFPCVTFSTAGRRMGVVDDINGKLYLELCRVIREVRPRYFVAENVRGILNANGGAAIKLVLAAFLRLGYRTAFELVNMADHGVPQTRERVVFVGVRLDEWRGSFAFPRKSHRRAKDGKAPKWLPSARTLGEAIGDLPAPSERVVGMMHSDSASKRKKGNAHGVASGYQNSLPRRIAEPSHSMKTDGATLLDEQRGDASHARNDAPVSPPHAMSKPLAHGVRPSPTIVSEAANVQPWIDGARRMTVRECARVQSFPDWFSFPESQADGYRLVGNAVPPLYAKRLALAIMEYDRREIVR